MLFACISIIFPAVFPCILWQSNMARRNIDDFPISMSIRTQISQPSKAAKLANDALFQKVPNYKKTTAPWWLFMVVFLVKNLEIGGFRTFEMFSNQSVITGKDEKHMGNRQSKWRFEWRNPSIYGWRSIFEYLVVGSGERNYGCIHIPDNN